MKRPSAMDELRDGAGKDQVLDDLERDILGAVRGVVTDFVAKRVGRPDLSDVDVDIELPAEAAQHEPVQPAESAPQNERDAGSPESDWQPQRRFGPGTALLPLLLIFSFGVLVVGAGLFYNHVIVGEIPLANGGKLQSIAVERQRDAATNTAETQSALTPTVVNTAPTLTGTISETSPTLPVAAVGQQPPANTAGGWVTTTTPTDADTRLDGSSVAGAVKLD